MDGFRSQWTRLRSLDRLFELDFRRVHLNVMAVRLAAASSDADCFLLGLKDLGGDWLPTARLEMRLSAADRAFWSRRVGKLGVESALSELSAFEGFRFVSPVYVWLVGFGGFRLVDFETYEQMDRPRLESLFEGGLRD